MSGRQGECLSDVFLKYHPYNVLSGGKKKPLKQPKKSQAADDDVCVPSSLIFAVS